MEFKVHSAFDSHVHLRQGDLMKTVVPMIKNGGASTVYVMPNLAPPIVTLQQAINYRNELLQIDPTIDYLMSLYLTTEIAENDIVEAKKNNVYGVKWYPKGVTTKSEYGVPDIKDCYHILKWIERENLILNIHGEVPFEEGVTVLNAEELFIPTLLQLRKDFPVLRIVMEHVTTAAMVRAIEFLDDNVAATITLHHLDITVNDWAGCSMNFCKPVAKSPQDKKALWDAVKSRNPKFFLGSDSAPHLRENKLSSPAHAGIFTSPFLLQYLAHLFESNSCLELLDNFSSGYGRVFYKLPSETKIVILEKSSCLIPNTFEVPYFKEGEKVNFRIRNQ
eukprot:NODE_709_length_4947_cov_0.132838.p2 type:complete len:334 gc:universal NODE_709_length_4947_cov_0.132838:324-1325(+)